MLCVSVSHTYPMYLFTARILDDDELVAFVSIKNIWKTKTLNIFYILDISILKYKISASAGTRTYHHIFMIHCSLTRRKHTYTYYENSKFSIDIIFLIFSYDTCIHIYTAIIFKQVYFSTNQNKFLLSSFSIWTSYRKPHICKHVKFTISKRILNNKL